jgi:hypothetical protein
MSEPAPNDVNREGGPECANAGSLHVMVGASGPKSKWERLEELTAKIERGERLNNQERLERQGLIFNHSGKCGKIVI